MSGSNRACIMRVFQQHSGYGQALFRSARSPDEYEGLICSMKILDVGDSVIDKGRDAGFCVLYFNHPRGQTDWISPFRFDG